MNEEQRRLELVLRLSSDIEQSRKEVAAAKAKLQRKEEELAILILSKGQRTSAPHKQASSKRLTGLSDTILAILAASKSEPLSTEEIAKRAHAEERLQSIRTLISRLVREKKIEKAGAHVYRLSTRKHH